MTDCTIPNMSSKSAYSLGNISKRNDSYISSVADESSINEDDFLKENEIEVFCRRWEGLILTLKYDNDNSYVFDHIQQHIKASIVSIDCTNYHPNLILNNELYELLEMMNNLVFVEFIVSDDMSITQNNFSDLLEIVQKPFILQCESPSSTFICYKNLLNNVTQTDLNLSNYDSIDEKQFYEMLSSSKLFDLNLLVDGLKLRLLGELRNSESHKSLLNINLNEWQLLVLIHMAIKHNNILILKFLLLFSDNISDDKLSIDNLKQLSSVKSSILQECKFSSEQIDVALNETLVTAVETGDLNLAKLLITLNCVNVNFRKCHLSVADIACKQQNYDILLQLLKGDSNFPKKNDLIKVDNESIAEFVKSRNKLHEMIKSGNEDCLAYIETLEKSTLYLNSKNDSALLSAIDNRQFKIYAALTSKGLKFKDKTELTVMNELSSAEKEQLKTTIDKLSQKPKDSAILYLLSKSMKSKGPMDETSRRQIKGYYKELLTIDTVDILFSVIENCDYLNIIYDFENGHVCGMNPTVSGNIKGLTCYTEGRIYIGAKRDITRLLGTIVHELTHLAMQIVYENDCNPFSTTDDKQRSIIERISLDFSKKWDNNDLKMDQIWEGVFLDENNYWSRELIARVPQMLAIHFDGKHQLNEQAKDLYEFYLNYVIPQCKTFVDKSYFLKVHSYISFLNCSSNVLNTILDIDVAFVNPIDIIKIGNRKPIKLLKTKSTLLTLISVCQTLQVSMPNAFVVFNFNRYLKIKANIHEALQSQVCNVMVLEVTTQEISEQILLAANNWLKLLVDNPTKMIVIIENASNHQIEPRLLSVGRAAVAKLYKHPIEDNFTLNDFDRKSQAKLLKIDVQFQGRVVKLGSVIDETAFGIVDSDILMKLLKKKPIYIGKKPSMSADFHEAFYIKRCFQFTDNNENEQITEDDLLNTIDENRIVLLCDVAGMGKTTVLTRMSLLIQNHWIIRIDLNHFLKDLRVEHSQRSFNVDNVENALLFLVEKLLKGNLETQFEKMLLLHNIRFKNNVIVMFDGFDEICPDYKQIVTELLIALTKSNIKQLWVSTRSHLRNLLEDALMTKSLMMIPFTKEDKTNFLIRFWITMCALDETAVKNKLDIYAEALLDSISSTIFDDQSFTEIPLQLRLLAEVHKSTLVSFVQSNKTTPSIENISLVEIYQRFIKEKYDIYFKDKTHIDHCLQSFLVEQEKDFDKSHKLLALELIFPNESVVQEYVTKKRLSENKLITASSIGIVKSLDGQSNIYFVHRTFAEYFLANFIVEILCEVQSSSEKYNLSKLLWSKMSIDKDYFSINNFINLLVTGHLPLHKAVINFDRQNLMKLLSNDNVDVNEVDKLGRTPLYLACSLAYDFGVKQLLVSDHCFLDQSDILGRTALHYAAAYGIETNVEILLHRVADFNHDDNIFSRPLLLDTEVSDCLFNKPQQIQSKMFTLINHEDHFDQTALCYSAMNKFESVSCILLSKGAIVTKAYQQYAKWFIDFIANFFDSIEFSIKTFEIVGLLLVVMNQYSSADLSLEGLTLNTVKIKRYFEYGHIKVIRSLESLCSEAIKTLFKKSDLNLIKSINRHKNFTDVEYLASVQNFLQSNLISDNTRMKFIQHAVESCGTLGYIETLKFLATGHFDLKCDYNLCFYEAVRNSQLLIIDYIWKNFSIEMLYNSFGSPLHYASDIGNLNVVKFLCENGANVNDQNNAQKCSPINYAVINGHFNVVKYLISKGANIMAEDYLKHNVLYVAILYGQSQIIEYLMPMFDISVEIDVNLNKIWKVMKSNGCDVNFKDENGMTLLHMVAQLRKPKLIKWLTKKGADVNCKDNKGMSPLHYACYKHQCNIDCFEVAVNLFAAGAVYNLKNDDDLTPLQLFKPDDIKSHCSIYILTVIDSLFTFLKSELGDVESLKTKIKSFKKLKFLNARDEEGNTILHLINDEMFRYIDVHFAVLRNDMTISVNAQNNNGDTPLHRAAKHNNIKILEILCERGAMINLKNDKQQTSCMLAQDEYILKRINRQEKALYVMRSSKIVALEDVISVNKKCILNVKDFEGKTILHLALINGWDDIANYLIDAFSENDSKIFIKDSIHASINSTDNLKRTPLHYAAINGNVTIINHLIKNGCCFNWSDVNGKVPYDLLETSEANALTLATLLLHAIQNDSPQSIQNLIESSNTNELLKFAVRAMDANGKTLLYYLCKSGNRIIVQLFLNNGAHVEDVFEDTDFAFFNSEIKELVTMLHSLFYYTKSKINITELISHADQLSLALKSRNSNGESILHQSSRLAPFILKQLVDNGADINAVDKYGNTALHCAIRHKDVSLIVAFVDCGASVNAKNFKGITPLMECNLDFFTCKYLISKGAEVNAKDMEGKTFLMKAVIEGWDNIVVLLLDSGANINIADIYGKTANSYVNKGNFRSRKLISNILDKHCADLMVNCNSLEPVQSVNL
ncbi:hypothetical protein CHUAL_007098 [Chamberlinius hualienensis]